MTRTRLLHRLVLPLLALLLASGCDRSREEKRLLVFSGPDAAPEAVSALQRIAAEEGIVMDTTTDPSVFVEDSLARYGAVVFVEASGDPLTHRQQADLERYIQAGGGFVGVGTRPARTWPWFNTLIGAQAATTPGGVPVRTAGEGSAALEPRRQFDGGRVAITRWQELQSPARLEELRTGIEYAIGKNRRSDFRRARTARVPEANRFQQEILVPGPLDEPTELAVARDGRVFFAERKGGLHLYDPATREVRQIAQIPVTHDEENGFIGLTLDPNFAENNWLYLNYSVADTLLFRVSRVTFTGSGITDEKVLLEVPYTAGCCHTGGSMTFDGRGNLFISFGDNTNPFESPYTPIDPTPGKELWDARRTSANTQDLRGKILRITPQPDGTYTIPEGNLFPPGTPNTRPEIYTMGHRNPYRISVDRRTGNLYWGEVGPDAREDSIYGPKGYDEVNQARRAGNFGWPMFIADNKPYLDVNWTSGTRGAYFDPQRPLNDSPNNTGARVLPPAQPAFIYYPYDASEEFPLVGDGGRNSMAGPVYHYGDFEGSELRLPAYYDGKFIHYDWMRGWMMATTMDENGNFVRMEPFLEHLQFDHPIDVELGPDGSLYVLEYGTYWFAKNSTAQLTRITFHPGNRPPTAQLAASDTVGAAPLTVTFSAAGSSDHDEGDGLSYAWRFGEGSTAEGPTVTQTFSRPGVYTARLMVRDASGGASEATQQIRVGNAPPQLRVAFEGNRSFYWDRGSPAYRVEVSDPEDGALGSGIDPQRVRVTLNYLPEGVGNTAVMPGHQVNITPRGQTLIEASNCSACHGVDEASVGPSFRMIANRYADKRESIPYLINKIIEGGGGVWGEHRMSAHPNLARGEAEQMVNYILSLTESVGLPPSGTLPLNQHRPGESGAYVLSASYEDQARNGIGPLRAQETIVLRPPFVRAAEIGDVRYIGTGPVKVADGTVRLVATAYADGAYLYLGPTDLTGVGRVRASLDSVGHPLTLELRAGGPEGRLIASQAIQAPRDRWIEAVVPVSAAGEHDLYLVLRSPVEGLGQWNPLARLDLIRFERAGG